MPRQHTRENAEEKASEMEIEVPLDLPGFRVLEQIDPEDGSLGESDRQNDDGLVPTLSANKRLRS